MNITPGASNTSSTSPPTQQQPVVTFKAFLDKMRHPAAADLVRSIKNFIQCQLDLPDHLVSANAQSLAIQEFLESTESSFKSHPLWRDARQEELEAAGEGLEKYLMTKLHDKTFGVAKEDKEQDEHLSALLQALNFVTAEHLDIPARVQKESTYAMAMKELNKMNMYKAPRDKLVCIMNCCYIINNLLGVASRSKDGVSRSSDGFGADDFLPILIFIVIQAKPEKIESNLQYIQRFRKASRLVSEAAYFFTNVMSATSFVSTVNADSLTIDRQFFIDKMKAAGIPFPDQEEVVQDNLERKVHDDTTNLLGVNDDGSSKEIVSQNSSFLMDASDMHEADDVSKSNDMHKDILSVTPINEVLEKIEYLGVASVAEMDGALLRKSYKYLYASQADLKLSDVTGLLNEYKELALKYECLMRGIQNWYIENRGDPVQRSISNHQRQQQQQLQTLKQQEQMKKEEKDNTNSKIIPGVVDYSSQQMPAESPPLVDQSPLIDLNSH